jgi:hypothetical protein
MFKSRGFAALTLLSMLLYSALLADDAFADTYPNYQGNINFTDVGRINGNGPGIYFIADNGWVSGYPVGDPTCANNGATPPCFLPNSSATRQQMSKFIVNAKLHEGITIQNPPVATFSDVPVGSTFYTYIETINYYGWATGYTGTDCTNSGLASPCFKPTATLTRGQFSKILTRAMNNVRHYVAPPTATFSDVPVGSTFYTYVETAWAHFAMVGSGSNFNVSSSITRGDIATGLYRLTALERQFTHNGNGYGYFHEGMNNYILGPKSSCLDSRANLNGSYPDSLTGVEVGFTQDYGGFSNYGIIGREIEFTANPKDFLTCPGFRLAIVLHAFDNPGGSGHCQTGNYDLPNFRTSLPVPVGAFPKTACIGDSAEFRIYTEAPANLVQDSAQYFAYVAWTPTTTTQGELNMDNYLDDTNNQTYCYQGQSIYCAKDNMQKFCYQMGHSTGTYGVYVCP